MSSPSVAPGADQGSRTETVARVLDPTVGFLVWAVHLVAIYVVTALSCQLRPGDASGRGRATLVVVLVLLTVVAAAIVVSHATRRYRQLRDAPARRFRASVTIGCDAIAVVAIVWQLLAILLVPACV